MLKQLLKQLFCYHVYERQKVNSLLANFGVVSIYKCSKCGKKKVIELREGKLRCR